MSIELKPVDKLPKPKRQVGSEYDEILKSFLKSEHKYAEIIIKKEIKKQSLASSIRNRIKKLGLKDRIKLREREGKLYLEKL